MLVPCENIKESHVPPQLKQGVAAFCSEECITISNYNHIYIYIIVN